MIKKIIFLFAICFLFLGISACKESTYYCGKEVITDKCCLETSGNVNLYIYKRYFDNKNHEEVYQSLYGNGYAHEFGNLYKWRVENDLFHGETRNSIEHVYYIDDSNNLCFYDEETKEVGIVLYYYVGYIK